RELKRPDEAIAQYEVAKRMRPEEEISWTALGSMYDEQGDTSKSEEILTEATNRFGLRGQVRTQLVGILRARIEKLKAEGKKAESRAIRRKLADLQVIDDALYDLKILMTWDAASDVDLDVYEPGGERVGHTGANSKAGGHYHGDNTRGLGPEVYTIAHAIPGLYQVAAHLHGSVRSKVKFVVILYEDTDREERREETVILDVAGQQQYIRDIIISR
ncbi:MAG: hypothetical protein HY293_10380, partial [Planctomycetes bacterium]|nr:hypothetical protein [Planctomycetota bacterium]